MSTQEIENLKIVSDSILIQASLNSVRLQALTNFMFSLCRETLEEEKFKLLYTSFANELLGSTSDCFDQMKGDLFQNEVFWTQQKVHGLLPAAEMQLSTYYIPDSDK